MLQEFTDAGMVLTREPLAAILPVRLSATAVRAMQLVRSGQTLAMFQIESPGQWHLVAQTQPDVPLQNGWPPAPSAADDRIDRSVAASGRWGHRQVDPHAPPGARRAWGPSRLAP